MSDDEVFNLKPIKSETIVLIRPEVLAEKDKEIKRLKDKVNRLVDKIDRLEREAALNSMNPGNFYR